MTDQAPTTTARAVRHDGWTEARRTQFLHHLAVDGSVRGACGRVGMSREAAYKMRRRDALFARAWNAALLLAREAGAEVLEDRAIRGIEEEVWYRGELVGTRRKYDSRLLLAHMARLDKIAEDTVAAADAARFDELLAVIGGEPVPEGHECDEEGLPAERDIHMDIAGDEAEESFEEAWAADHPEAEEPEEAEDPEEIAARADREVAEFRAHRAALVDARARARLAAGAQWDEWRGQTHEAVDRLLAERIDQSGTVSGMSTSPAHTIRPGTIAEAYAHTNPINHRYARA
jgi:hypothetical protein